VSSTRKYKSTSWSEITEGLGSHVSAMQYQTRKMRRPKCFAHVAGYMTPKMKSLPRKSNPRNVRAARIIELVSRSKPGTNKRVTVKDSGPTALEAPYQRMAAAPRHRIWLRRVSHTATVAFLCAPQTQNWRIERSHSIPDHFWMSLGKNLER
jgi:hypothetical protein